MASVGFALVAMAHLAFAIHLLRSGVARRPLERAAAPFLAAVLATAAWGLLGLADFLSTKVWAWHGALAFDQLRYVAWAFCLLALLQRPADGAVGWRQAAARGWLPAALLLLATVGLSLDLWLGLTLRQPEAAALRLLAAVQLAWAVCGLVMVEQVFRNQGESSRWSAKPLCLGLGGVFLYDIYLFAPTVMFGGFDDDALGARGLVHALAVPLLLVASRRQAHWLARVQVSKTAAFYSASMLLIGAYLLFIAGAGYYVKFFGGTWGGTLQVALLAAALLGLMVLVFSGALRARLRVFLNKHFFSYSYDYRLEWLRFTAMLSSKSTPQEVGALVVRALADMVECPAGALWFDAAGDGTYVQTSTWNMPQSAAVEPAQSPFCRLMGGREWIVDVAEARASAGVADAVVLPSWLAQIHMAWIAVPLLVGEDMLGFVVLAEPRTPIALNWEVRDLLKTASRQAASFLALMNATEALLETRKFDAFNRMSAFVVHDLKNIVTQLSLMLKNVERHRENPEFQQDMLMTVANSLEKMKQLMLQLREGEGSVGRSLGVALAPLLERLLAAMRRRGRDLKLQIDDHLHTRGDEQRLERVVGHVMQNALDATQHGGTVSVTLDRAGGRVRLVVADTGVGMSDEFIRTRLFRPFHSTKASGMGIGSYETMQYLRQIGGSIDVSSEFGKGSRVTLWMPLFEHPSEQDLYPMHSPAR